MDNALHVPIRRELVLVGGGHSHVAVLKRFGMAPMPGVRLTLVTRDVLTPYSGMIPGYIAGEYALDECHLDLAALSHFAGARLIRASATGLDLERRQVVLGAHRPPLNFDVVSINVGSTPDRSAIEGGRELGIPVKPIDGFLARLRAWVDGLAQTTAARAPRVAVVGAGAGGVEVAITLETRLRALLGDDSDATGLEMTLVSGTPDLLPNATARVGRIIGRRLAERGVEVLAGHRVVAATETDDGALCLEFESASSRTFDQVIWATHAGAAGWLGDTGLALDNGFVAVDACYRSISHRSVFAAGDCIHNTEHPRPRSGVYAVRAGPPLAENLRRALRDESPRPHRPQRRHLSIIGTGDGRAVLSRGPLAFEGAWVWTLKDRIDRRWMAQYRDLPVMEPPRESDPLAQPEMYCAGCGSKVGADVLRRALERVGETASAQAPGVVLGLDAPDDAALLEVPPGQAIVESIDALRSFVGDPWRFGRIAAVHALGDLWAMGAQPWTALALATLPHSEPDVQEGDLTQLLAGALDALTEAGATLVGGHTMAGAEMVFGLQVTGLVAPDAALRKSGARPGDALVLTRALGTGIVLAAAMRRSPALSPDHLEAALASMSRSNAAAAAILREHGATACTDVTGFGLAGHLLELLIASGCGARLRVAALPVLAGAEALAAAGVASSLAPANARNTAAALVGADTVGAERRALLADPQTAGGLLASVPRELAEACCAALVAAGIDDVAIVGEMVAGPATIALEG